MTTNATVDLHAARQAVKEAYTLIECAIVAGNAEAERKARDALVTAQLDEAVAEEAASAAGVQLDRSRPEQRHDAARAPRRYTFARGTQSMRRG